MGIDNNFSPLTHTTKIEGAEAKGRAWFYILLGIACGCAAAMHFINVRSWKIVKFIENLNIAYYVYESIYLFPVQLIRWL